MPNRSPPCSPKSRLLNRIRRTRLESTLKSAGPAWYRRGSQATDAAGGGGVDAPRAVAGDEGAGSGLAGPELSTLGTEIGGGVVREAFGAASKMTEARSTAGHWSPLSASMPVATPAVRRRA